MVDMINNNLRLELQNNRKYDFFFFHFFEKTFALANFTNNFAFWLLK